MDRKSCIFDMDGTLVDSMGYWRNLSRNFLRQKGVLGPINDVLELAKPLPLIDSTRLFIERFGLAGTPEDMAAEMSAVMKQHYLHDVSLKSGAGEYLEKLKRDGIKMCVVTATPPELVGACLSHLNLLHYFEFLLSCDEVGVGKNHPDAFLEAARRFNVPPIDVAVFEDSLQAAETAMKAGFYTVGVYDKHSVEYWNSLSSIANETIVDWNVAVKNL